MAMLGAAVGGKSTLSSKIFAGLILATFFILFIVPTFGKYCAQRGCCLEGRDDECNNPYPNLGPETLCYCDSFCNRTQGDCCPDFLEVCLGVKMRQPKKLIRGTCCHDGTDYEVGGQIKINCNYCTCKEQVRGFYSFECENNPCLIREDLADKINNMGDQGWTAGNYSKFWGMRLDEGVKHRLGTMKPTPAVEAMNEIQMDDPGHDEIPESFDARTHWPELLEPVMDQGDCASSWAFSTAAVASDRLSIQSNGTMKVDLSPQHLLSCNVKRQQGCHGGHLDRAWWYLRKRGIVTNECYPYNSGLTPEMKMQRGACYIPGVKTVDNKMSCPKLGMKSSRYQSTPPYRISPSSEEIQMEIMKNGPVQAAFHVREDFFMYQGGVYRYTAMTQYEPETYRRNGWHSVRILGWGIDKTDPNPDNHKRYWLCANSWGTDWGEDGYFRVMRGTNECEIESFVIGAWGKVESMDMENGDESAGKEKYAAQSKKHMV